MDFNRAEQEYVRLKALYNQGDLTAEAFEAAGNDALVVRDRFGHVWQIGVNSGKWYCFENGTWTQKEPDETLLPSTGNPLETPETLQAPPKPAPIFTLPSQPSDSEPSAEAQAAPVPREKLKNGGRPSPAQIRKSFSWIGLVGVALLLVLGIFGLSTLLMREQSFGWNPGTPVRFGSPTPTRPGHSNTGFALRHAAFHPNRRSDRHTLPCAQSYVHRRAAVRAANLGAKPGHLLHLPILPEHRLADCPSILRSRFF